MRTNARGSIKVLGNPAASAPGVPGADDSCGTLAQMSVVIVVGADSLPALSMAMIEIVLKPNSP